MLGNKGGRPSVPDKIKKLQGTDRKDREIPVVEFTKLTVIPKPEVWLENKAKKYFTNLCRLLIGKELLTDGNVSLVLMMAQEFATYENAVRELKKKGYTVKAGAQRDDKPSPWISIRNESLKNYMNIATRFGLDPISAVKVPGGKKEDKDPFEEMMKKYNQ